VGLLRDRRPLIGGRHFVNICTSSPFFFLAFFIEVDEMVGFVCRVKLSRGGFVNLVGFLYAAFWLFQCV